MATCFSAAIILCVNSKSSILGRDKRDSLWKHVFETGKRVVLASPADMATGSRIRCEVCPRSCFFRVKVTHFWLHWSLLHWPWCQTRAWGWGRGLERRRAGEPKREGERERGCCSKWRNYQLIQNFHCWDFKWICVLIAARRTSLR